MKYNTVLRYGCARVRSVGLFELPYFTDLVNGDLRHKKYEPYTDYTHEKKSPQKAKYTVMASRQNAPDMMRRNSTQKVRNTPQGYSVDLPCRKSAKYFFGAVDIVGRVAGVQNQFPKNFHDVSKIIFVAFRI